MLDQTIIYLVSGPIGVGKSTTSKELARNVPNCVLIHGDSILQMFDYGLDTAWEQRLRLTWENILAITKNFTQHGFSIVIDFVVEDELEWFCQQINDLPVTLKYIVLRADKEKLIERIHSRGDHESIDRSLFLLKKLESLPSNKPYLYDTTLKHTAEIVDTILNNNRFSVKK
ncbi:AAA family ATPase [Metabacillus niabensis]|uniref:AAA family ATPase n=1 Tax=Metabacillus niabensis TaxID=324854 RepID=UPI001CF94350|nr:AAA family ATPase [Metabacillus niabensis]